MNVKSEYVPGVCNIGPAERRLRRTAAYISSGITLLVLLCLVVVDAPIWLRLILIFPASFAATNLIQDRLHFCAAFGIRGIFNTINSAGITDSVELEEFRQKDRRKALLILISSAAIGIGFTGLSLLIPSL